MRRARNDLCENRLEVEDLNLIHVRSQGCGRVLTMALFLHIGRRFYHDCEPTDLLTLYV